MKQNQVVSNNGGMTDESEFSGKQKSTEGPRITTNLWSRYTFWVAAVVLALTIFFGVVQSIEGAIQVYYAAHSS